MIDCVGNEIREGDVLRMFHFVNSFRRRKEFMYKKVGAYCEGSKTFKVYHLDSVVDEIKLGYFFADQKDFNDSVVVQRAKYSAENLKRSKFFRD